MIAITSAVYRDHDYHTRLSQTLGNCSVINSAWDNDELTQPNSSSLVVRLPCCLRRRNSRWPVSASSCAFRSAAVSWLRPAFASWTPIRGIASTSAAVRPAAGKSLARASLSEGCLHHLPRAESSFAGSAAFDQTHACKPAPGMQCWCTNRDPAHSA